MTEVILRESVWTSSRKLRTFGVVDHLRLMLQFALRGRGVLRSRDLQTIRARLGGHERIDSLFDSDTYAGRPHPLSKVIVPEPLAVAWAPFARRAAFAAHRERSFDCVLTTSPPESARSSQGRSHRGTCRRAA